MIVNEHRPLVRDIPVGTAFLLNDAPYLRIKTPGSVQPYPGGGERLPALGLRDSVLYWLPGDVWCRTVTADVHLTPCPVQKEARCG